MTLLSLDTLCTSTPLKVGVADLSSTCYCPIWFSKDSKEREQAKALCHLGFSYQGEDEDFSIESNLLTIVGQWVFYSVDDCLIVYFDEAKWISNLPSKSLPQILQVFQQQQEIENERFKTEILIGFSSNANRFDAAQIAYALEAIAGWINRYRPQSSPALQAIIEELSHE